MKQIRTLRTFETGDAALKAIDTLYELFLKENKRKEKVELYFSVTCSAAPKYNGFFPNTNAPKDTYAVRCYFEPEDAEEYIWMQNKINEL